MIRFDQVTKSYPGNPRPALNDVTLEVLKGEFVFLVGASGSGKSSFLRLILKEERPNKGKIHVLGHDLTTLANRKVPYFRRSLGVVFQDFRLLPAKTVFDNVAFTLQVIGKSKGYIQEAVPDVLKMVGLAGKAGRLPHELSGGEQQRVAIARAIVNKPAILLADEPTGNLDPATSAGIMSLLSTINANGTTILMATHDSGIVDTMKRRVIELSNGNVLRDERSGGYQTQAIPVQQIGREMQLESERIAAVTAPHAQIPDVSTATAGIRALLDGTARPSAPPVAPSSTPPVQEPRQGGDA
ncbi:MULTISPECIES: cell division ATP-binding protein FtsE [unclassified Salinibacterium]|uniref:cell division ATP-binding protein FtsE n=1 Tax=unclassified Salinibacterium TaxID=2632331 RepID=UPI001CD7849D|nr:MULTISPECIES: cell division ATP-binding protein FtsE [unclassified Salinibacterium]